MKLQTLFIVFFLFTFWLFNPPQSFAANFELIGSHPVANTFSGVGAHLHGGIFFDNRIYWSYGNWGNNNDSYGALEVYTMNPDTGSFTREFVAQTEAIYDFRVHSNGKLYFAHIDPYNFTVNKDYSRKDGSNWTQVHAGLWHIFDVQEMNNRLYLFGSMNDPGDAVVYESDPGETNIRRILSVSSLSGTTRFFFGFVYNNKLYVQADKLNNSNVYNGTSWSFGPNLLAASGHGSHSNPFQGKIIYQSQDQGNSGPLLVFNGQSVSTARANVIKYTIFNNQVYTIESDGNIAKTSDLNNWNSVSQSGVSDPTSIVIANNRIFLGTATGTVYRSTFTLNSTTPTNTPTIANSTNTQTPSESPQPSAFHLFARYGRSPSSTAPDLFIDHLINTLDFLRRFSP